MSTVPPTISRRSSVLAEAEHQGLVQLKMQLRKESQNSWREFVEQTTASVEREHNAGLSRWARRRAGRLREKHSPSTRDNREKAQILAEKFFPPPEDTDLSDVTGEAAHMSRKGYHCLHKRSFDIYEVGRPRDWIGLRTRF
jgi:hypothetical protein